MWNLKKILVKKTSHLMQRLHQGCTLWLVGAVTNPSMAFLSCLLGKAQRSSEVQTIAHWKMSILWLQNKLTLCWEILPIPQLLCPQNCIWKRSLFSWPIWTSWLNKRKNRIALNYNACFFGVKMTIQYQIKVLLCDRSGIVFHPSILLWEII